jgi:hypothetical protein
MWDWIRDHSSQEWRTLKQAPVIFLFILAVGGIAGYYVSTAWHNERISVLKERIAQKDEALNELQKVNARLDSQGERIKDIEGKLSADQVTGIIDKLSGKPPSRANIRVNEKGQDERAVADQLRGAFEAGGWDVTITSETDAATNDGVVIATPDRGSARSVAETLSDAGVGYREEPYSTFDGGSDFIVTPMSTIQSD